MALDAAFRVDGTKAHDDEEHFLKCDMCHLLLDNKYFSCCREKSRQE